MASVQEIVDRLSRYDKSKYPPDSPAVVQTKEKQPTDGRSTEEVDEIVTRLCQFNKRQGPPGSSVGRQDLGYNRFDFYNGPDISVPSKHVSSEELDSILSRLRTPYERRFRGGRGHAGAHKDIRKEEEVQEIFERLGKFEKKKGPPGSNGGRVNLGYNRYDFGDDKVKKHTGPYRSQEEIDEIITRLATFDITKGPPGSRGHESKKV